MEQEKCMYVIIQGNGERRLLSIDEEWEKLNKGFEELIKWDQMVAKSQRQSAENRKNIQNNKLDDLLLAHDVNQACEYIQDTYLEFRSCYLKEYEQTGRKCRYMNVNFFLLVIHFKF